MITPRDELSRESERDMLTTSHRVGSPYDLYHRKGQFYDMVYHSGELEELQKLMED